MSNYKFKLNLKISNYDDGIDDYVFNYGSIEVDLNYKLSKADIIKIIISTVNDVIDNLDYYPSNFEADVDGVIYDYRSNLNNNSFSGLNRNTQEINIDVEIEN